MNDDTLLPLLRAPAFVERALRKTLAEMLAIRRAIPGDCDARSFVKLALATSRTLRDRTIDSGDILARHELEAAIVRAAVYFASSPLGKRLRTIPIERIVASPPGIDLAVRDRFGRLHYVRLEIFPGTQARLEAVARAVRAMDDARLTTRASLHLFSLRDGTLRSYPARSERQPTRAHARHVANATNAAKVVRAA